MRPTPYPQKRQPAKRIALKKHESIVNVMEQRIRHLEAEIQKRNNLIAKLMLGKV